MTQLWQRAWRNLRRDAAAGELRLVMLAVMLAVAALTSVGFFADRLKGQLQRDARQLLGGDAVVASDNPLPESFVQQAQALGLRTAATVSFPSMARASDAQGGATRLVAVKAVPEAYPLRGALRVSLQPGGPDAVAGESGPRTPARGEVWLDAAVLDSLNLKVGDALLLGDASLKISRVITQEPDRGAGFMSFSPRVMLAAADLPATGLIQPASRVNYRLAVAASDDRAANPRAVRQFSGWAEAQIKSVPLRGVRLESLEGGRPEMRQTLDRAEKFLNLVALLAALLAAVAVGIAARNFAERRLDDCAMLRVLGLSQRQIALTYALQFLLMGLAASAVGTLAGWGVHHAFVWLLGGLVEAALPPPTWVPAAFGMGVGLTLLFAFALPPVLQLAAVPPLRVIRRDLGGLKAGSVLVLGLAALGFAALLMVSAGDAWLGGIAVGGFAAAVALFAALGWLAVRALRAIVREESAPRWLVLATRQLAARPAFAVVQVASLGVGLLALVLLVLLRTDLIASWRQATPPDAPNRFVINVQPEQGEAFRQRLVADGVSKFDWYPMIRGRLVAINGKPVSMDDFSGDRAKRLVDREFNLSHAAAMPVNNELVAGAWAPPSPGGGSDAISVEQGIADTLGLKLGDALTFDIAGTPRSARIANLRKVDWGSFRVNFFVIFQAESMPDVPTTYIAAFRAPAAPQGAAGGSGSSFDSRLQRDFPNITNVDVSLAVDQVQRVLGQIIRAVEFLFVFTLAAGLVVLFAAVVATRETRSREYAVMRALGAGQRLLAQVQRAELAGVGLLAGLLASVVAVAVGWGLARFVFEFDWVAKPWVPLAGALAGAALASAAGWWGLRGVLRRPVVQTLREAG
jgi:putative ABC transport system permease protein